MRSRYIDKLTKYWLRKMAEADGQTIPRRGERGRAQQAGAPQKGNLMAGDMSGEWDTSKYDAAVFRLRYRLHSGEISQDTAARMMDKIEKFHGARSVVGDGESELQSRDGGRRKSMDHRESASDAFTRAYREGGNPVNMGMDHDDEAEHDSLRAIIAASYAVDHDFGVLVQIMAQCGLRPGEGLGLRRCDLDLASGEVHVRGTFSRSRMGPTKTRSSTRVVSLLDHVVVDEALSQSVLSRIKAMKVSSMDPEERMWPLGATGYLTRWKRAVAKAGVRHRKLHALRHSFASILLSRGENILRVQKAGGWSSATILLGTYSRWIDEGAKRPPTRAGARSLATSKVNARGR